MHLIGVNNDWTVKLETNGTDVNYNKDLGAQVNIMPESIYQTLKQKSELKPTKVKLTTYNKRQILVIGQCEGKINYQDKNINSCFGDIGSLRKTHHISVKPEVTPTISPARRVPITLRDKLKSELDNMTKLDVIEPTSKPTKWVNLLVTVEKPNGKLRVCLDPRDLNKAMKQQHYKLTTSKELFSEMTSACCFSKLNATNGYWQIKIDTESSKLLTFATLFGKFCFKCLPYSILSASEIFQANISKIIEGLEGARNSQDDIIVQGKTLAKHSDHASKVMTKIRESGLKLNKLKCLFKVQSITFLGH